MKYCAVFANCGFSARMSFINVCISAGTNGLSIAMLMVSSNAIVPPRVRVSALTYLISAKRLVVSFSWNVIRVLNE